MIPQARNYKLKYKKETKKGNCNLNRKLKGSFEDLTKRNMNSALVG